MQLKAKEKDDLTPLLAEVVDRLEICSRFQQLNSVKGPLNFIGTSIHDGLVASYLSPVEPFAKGFKATTCSVNDGGFWGY